MDEANGFQEPVSTSTEGLETRIKEASARIGDRKKVANLMGISEAQLYRYLKGEGAPSVSSLVALAKAADVSIDWLATGKGGQGDVGLTPDYGYIPLYNVRASAGEGNEFDRESVVSHLAFNQTWLKNELKANPKDLVAIIVQGESMEPTLSDGDAVLINTQDSSISRDGIYVFRMGNGLSVKRLQHMPGGLIRAKSDNPSYEPFDFRLDELGADFTVIGRVVWVAHKF